MRKSISIAIVAAVAGAALWTWTLSNSGANARNKFSPAQGIDTLELTKQAKDLPLQQFDAI
jgi:hypothetical protein